jgi:tetratricopeptide (TPR) repeat protein
MPSFPVWGFVLVYGATVVATLVSSRYRLPVMPFLIVLAGRGFVVLADSVAARATLRLAAGSLVAGFVFAGSRSFPAPRDASEANGLTWVGLAEAQAGHGEKAIAMFERAIELFPTNCDPHVDLAATLLEAKRTQEALSHLQRAVELCPENVQALDAMTDLVLKLGRTEEARALAERSIRVAPHLSRARYNLGKSWLGSGSPSEAAAAFRAALERKPDYFNAAFALGMTSLDLGRTDEAIDALGRAVASGKDSDGEFLFQAFGTLIETLVQSGRRAEAREMAKKMVERFPKREEARRILAGLQSS